MDKKDKEVIERISLELEKIKNDECTLYFFVLDTKGNPSGSLEYIYKLAYILHEDGYNVIMLYQEDEEFVGVRDWLGDKYADLPHQNIMDEKTSVSASDVLFIPEIFASVMTQTKHLPCKRVAILQNYGYITEQIPISVQWGDLNIFNAIVNTRENEKLLHSIFPYVNTTLVEPYIDEKIYDVTDPKKLIVNLITKKPSDVNRIIKPFYWAYPHFKWVSFRDLRGFSKEKFAEYLREGAITVVIDDDANVGYSALEAMKSGSYVMMKLPDNKLDWMMTPDGNLVNGCLWFDNLHEAPRLIAQLVRAWVTNNVPQDIIKDGKKIAKYYSKEKTTDQILSFVEKTLDNREEELENLIKAIKEKDSHE